MCFVLDSSRYNLISAITDDGLRDISKVINNIKEEPKILTIIRPYKDKDLIKQVEDEMEDMMNEMKTNSKQ